MRSKGPPSIAFVENRQILLHARLALEHFGIPTKAAILVISGEDEANRTYVRKAIDPTRWLRVVDPFDPNPRPHIVDRALEFAMAVQPYTWPKLVPGIRRAIQCIRALAAEIRQVDYLVGGVYASEVARTFSSLVTYDTCVLVDDGNMTRFTAESRSAEQAVGFSRVLGVNSHRPYDGMRGAIQRGILYFALGVVDRGIPSLTFFTSHSALVVGPRDRVIINRYGSSGRRSVVHSCVHFLGAPAIRRGIVPEDVFRRSIVAVRQHYRRAGAKVLYYCHPHEGPEEQRIVGELWPEAHRRDNSGPYEGFIADSIELPQRIGGFYSSAFANLLAMDLSGVQLDVFRLPIALITPRVRRNRVRAIYESLECAGSEQLSMIDLEDLPAGDVE